MKHRIRTPFFLLTLLALTFSALGVAPASAKTAQESVPLQAEKVSPDGLLNPDGTLKLDGSFNGALDLEGWDVRLDPASGPVFSPTAPTDQWSNLGSVGDGSLNGSVYALAVSGTDLYVGGYFTNAGEIAEADYIAKWNGTNWSALGSNGAGDGSLKSTVYALAVSGTDLYVGGNFQNVNNGTVLDTADYIAKWDTLAGSWSALGSNGAGDGSIISSDPFGGGGVFALAVSGTDLYVGGYFTDVNNNGTVLGAADNIAKWNGTNWSALGSNGAGDGSLNNSVIALAVNGTDLYVGGSFTDVNNNGTILGAADWIAKWDALTGNWSELGSNGAEGGSINNYVTALAVNGTDLYVGGTFTDVNNNGTILGAADRIAKWDALTGNWSALGSNGAGDGSLNGSVTALAVSGTDLYLGGYFTDVNNNGTVLGAADFIAKWDTLAGNWSALGSNGAGDGSLKSGINELAVIGTDVYTGGSFTNVNNNGTVLGAADCIAKWNGTSWSALGSVPNGAISNGTWGGYVYSIAISGTDLYVGGWFTNAGGIAEADYIAKWDTLTGNWSALGSNGAGDGSLNGDVIAIAFIGADMYVGGYFTDVNNSGTLLATADNVAKWNGTDWSALGSNGAGDGSLNNGVQALAVSGTDLFVGGKFTNVNNNGMVLGAADYIAKWNTLTGNWSALGSNGAGDGSLNSPIFTLAVIGTDLYAGGWIYDVNNNGTVLGAADRVAKWDGTNWSALGSNGAGDGSLNDAVYALAVSGTDLYVGGYFTNANNNGTVLGAADMIAKWDTLTGNWSALGVGASGNGSLNSSVYALAIIGTDVYAGGYFTDVNNNGTVLGTADYIAKWDSLTGNWSALGSNGAGNGSLDANISVLTVSGTGVYVGGAFKDVNNNGTVLGAADVIAAYGITVPHTVTFNANSGSGTMAPQVSNAPAPLTSNAFTHTGYSFTGWNTKPDGSGTAYANGATYNFFADITLYAQWTALLNRTVTFNANGGSGSMAPQVSNVPAALTSNAFTRPGYTFTGWNTAADGSGTAYANGDIYNFSADLTLYAQWSPVVVNHTVTFNANGGLGSMAPQVSSVPAVLTANAFTRPGYTFTGWNTAADGTGTAYANGAIYNFSADLTLYAQWTATATFQDVPTTYWAWSFIERLYSAGITGGCTTSPLNYCPTSPVTRAQMAIFLEKGIHGSSFSPADVPATFTDTVAHWAEDWIEALKQDGVTSGCGTGIYCPENPVTRGQMAVFLLKAKHGSSYSPPDVSATFGDTSGHWAEDWIEQLAAEGITSGCGGGNYCPENTVTRDQMAVFLVKAFNLP